MTRYGAIWVALAHDIIKQSPKILVSANWRKNITVYGNMGRSNSTVTKSKKN